jgi:hypothetical protein
MGADARLPARLTDTPSPQSHNDVRPAAASTGVAACSTPGMIRKLPNGKFRLYSRKVDARTGRRRNLGTFASRAAAEKHERAVQYFKRR